MFLTSYRIALICCVVSHLHNLRNNHKEIDRSHQLRGQAVCPEQKFKYILLQKVFTQASKSMSQISYKVKDLSFYYWECWSHIILTQNVKNGMSGRAVVAQG